jgi:hypothetical protein
METCYLVPTRDRRPKYECVISGNSSIATQNTS